MFPKAAFTPSKITYVERLLEGSIPITLIVYLKKIKKLPHFKVKRTFASITCDLNRR